MKWLLLPVEMYLQLDSPVVDYTQDTSVYIKSKQADIDVGQHFNNFRVHADDRKYMGVKFVQTITMLPELPSHHWICVVHRYPLDQDVHHTWPVKARILEKCKGDTSDLTEPFHFARVILNLPYALEYDSAFPREMLIRSDGELASQEINFVGDIHPAGRCKDGVFHYARDGCRFLKSRMNSRGNIADDRKYRSPCLCTGAWNGILIHTNTPFPMKSTTGKKWGRFRDGLQWIVDQSEKGDWIDTAEIRRIAGLGVNITEVYTVGRSFLKLKGFFNAIEAWRYGRDCDGWGLDNAMISAHLLEVEDATRSQAQRNYPALTRIASELLAHAKALLRLFSSTTPLMVPLRPADKHKLRYVVGDAPSTQIGRLISEMDSGSSLSQTGGPTFGKPKIM
ncbi:LOW QUALITY PROTEIN: hypothetical protein ACHAXR_008890 [Thalassiosira sp. AJA248-18]